MEEMTIPPEQPVQEPEDTVVFKRSYFYSVMVVFAFAAGILVGYMAWGRGPSTEQILAAVQQAVPAQAAPQAQAPAQQGPVAEVPVTAEPQFTRYDIPIDGYPSLGPDDAEIVLVEFGDFQ